MTISVIVPVETFYIIPSTATLFAGRTLALKVNGTPGNATYHTAHGLRLGERAMKASPPSMRRGVVTGVSEGVAIITATSHNGIEETCTVYVTMPVGKIELSLVDAEKAEVGIGRDAARAGCRLRRRRLDGERRPGCSSWRVSNSNARITDNGDGTATVTGVRGGTVQDRRRRHRRLRQSTGRWN